MALSAAAVAAVQTLPFAAVAYWRFVDIDEGTYLAAAKLSLQGTLPYHDFLYVQTPLLPYVYGAWAALVGENWYLARMLSVLFAIAVGVLLHRHASERFGPRAAWAGLVLYVSSGLVLAWYPTVKTYALSTLLLFGAYVVVERAGAVSGRRWLAAGALAGLAVDTRLIFVAALPALVWAAARRGSPGRFAAGVALGLVPSLVFVALDARRFLFDNVLYHSTKSSGGLVGDLDQKGRTVLNLLGVGTPEGGLPQFLLLVVAVTMAAAATIAIERRLSLALAIGASLGIASLVPTPTYGQYLCTTVPFLVVGVLELVALVRARSGFAEDAHLRRLVAALGATFVAVYALLGAADLRRYVTGHAELRIAAVKETATVVQAHTRPGERVLASWPGYVFGTHALPVRGLETDFAPSSASVLTARDAHRYRMATVEDVERMVRERRTRLLVYQNWDVPPPVPEWEASLRRGGYQLVATVDTTKIYAR